jgi:hypothetical protein
VPGTAPADDLTGLDAPALDNDALETDGGVEPVTAGRPAGAGPARSGASGGATRPAPRQQPRRTGSAAKRRPAGKKKRR